MGIGIGGEDLEGAGAGAGAGGGLEVRGGGRGKPWWSACRAQRRPACAAWDGATAQQTGQGRTGTAAKAGAVVDEGVSAAAWG